MKIFSFIHVGGVAAAVLAAACGSVSTKADAGMVVDTAPAGDFSFAINPGALTVGITGEGTVAIDLMRGEGFTDAVSLSITGAPTGVTAEFDASSLPDGTNTTNLSVTADATASAGTSTLTVTATGGGRSHMATLDLTLTTTTVTGKVRGDTPGITVRLVGKPAIQTDSTGTFTFTDVKVPYDIYVLGQGGPSDAPIPAITYYKGLTRNDPVLTREAPYCVGTLCIVTTFNNRSATITGSRLGAGTNAGPTYLKFTTTDGSEINADGTWSFNAAWFQLSGTTLTGRLQGLQAIRGALGAPTGWYFAESADVTLTSGNSSNINLTLAALGTTGVLTGTVTQPAGFPMPTVTLSQQLAGFVFEVWTATTNNAASTVPLLTNQKASLHAISTSAGAVTEGVVPGIAASTDVTMMLPPPAGITGPVNNATNVTTSTPFEFTTGGNQVYQVRISSGSAIYVIYTTSGSLTIPDASEMPLPSNTNFTWSVTGYGPATSVDAAADETALRGVAKFESSGTLHTVTRTPTRSFTTQ